MGRKRIVAFESPELYVPRYQVQPGPGKLAFRCGRCGVSEFAVHVRAVPDGDVGDVSDLVCVACKTVFNVARGQLEGIQESI